MTCSLHFLFTFVYIEAHILCRVQCILSLVTYTGLEVLYTLYITYIFGYSHWTLVWIKV